MPKQIYLDNAATTKISKEVLAAMLPFLKENYGNPSSLHSLGRKSSTAVEEARRQVADLINAHPNEIILTSGGTEADNLALFGVANIKKKGHIITSTIEHPAILEACNHLEKNGFSVTYVKVDKDGFVNPADVEKSIRKDTMLVTIMHANNEIGTIQNIREIGKICREKKVLFHTDAVQSIGKLPIDVVKDNIDLLTISSHKIYGPKGVGALYVKTGVKLEPLVFGGGQEKAIRSGTENVSGIIGFGKACETAKKDLKDVEKIKKLRDKLILGVLGEIDHSWLNGSQENRLANNVNFGFKYIEGEAIIYALDAKGICSSTGSACSSHKLEPSHVLLAIGLKHEDAHGSVRLTLSKYTTEKEIDYVIKVLPDVIKRLREISPFKGEDGKKC